MSPPQLEPASVVFQLRRTHGVVPCRPESAAEQAKTIFQNGDLQTVGLLTITGNEIRQVIPSIPIEMEYDALRWTNAVDSVVTIGWRKAHLQPPDRMHAIFV